MQNVREYSNDELVALVPLPADDANKYSRGTLAAIVGSERYPGAACLAAYAGQRMGAGYTEVFTSPSAVPLVQGFRPSLVVRPRAALKANLPAAKPGKPRAYLVGCGFDAEAVSYTHLFTMRSIRRPRFAPARMPNAKPSTPLTAQAVAMSASEFTTRVADVYKRQGVSDPILSLSLYRMCA